MRRFHLVRYFSLTSLAGLVAVLAVLVFFYRSFAFEALEQHENQSNVAITRVFASTVWPEHADYFQAAPGLSGAQLQAHPEVASIRADIVRQMQGLSVVKVKIYDLRGRIVFSTDAKDIGEDASADEAVMAAIAGKTSSEIAFKNQFDAFERVINDRNLISSYVPIRLSEQQPAEGVFEVYSDVTGYVAELERTTLRIVALVMASLGLLYGFLFLIVRRAAATLQSQSEEVARAHTAILAHQASHDPLTHLPNRANLTQRLTGLLDALQQRDQKCVVLNIGLDGFKEVNDTLGPLVGDQALKDIARRLTEQLREADIVARVDGDEFAVVLSDASDVMGFEHIVTLVQRVQDAVAGVIVGAKSYALTGTASVGVALFPDDGADAAALLMSANSALAHAKKRGRATYQFHTAGMNARALELLLLERELRTALAEHQFRLYYQPQVDLQSGRVIGAEALIRWQHPQRGLLSPAHFIPMAEERGQIVAIGKWVLREACRQSQAWQKAGMAPVPVAINLAAQHFQEESLVPDVVQALRDHAIEPAWLELELTETSVMHNVATATRTMQQLKAVGVLLALDDFGTGFSSLSQLKRLPLDSLKIDQSFVRGLPDDAHDLALCSAVLVMGRAMGMGVIAEGVETPEQLAALRDMGCNRAQGYLLAQPLTADAFLAHVQSQT